MTLISQIAGTRQARWPRNRRLPALVLAVAGATILLIAAVLVVAPGEREEPSRLVGGLAAGVPGAAQVHSHPGRTTHIYDGSCDLLGDVAYALNPVGAGEMTGSVMAGTAAMAIGDAVGAAAAIPVEIGRITLAASLDEILAAPRAISVHRAELDLGKLVACGEVGGARAGDTLAFGLHPLNGSRFAGLAVLEGRGDETVVTVYLAEGLAGAVVVTPVA